MTMPMRVLAACAAALALGAGCSPVPPLPDGEPVQVVFTATGGSGVLRSGAMRPLFTDPLPPPRIEITGQNGTLVIHHLAILVSAMALEQHAGGCGFAVLTSEIDPRRCVPLHWAPTFVVPLSEAALPPAFVPEGRFDGARLRVLDLKDEPATGEMARARADLKRGFPDWPENASMRVGGVFVPVSGQPRAFLAYGGGEAELEFLLVPPLEVPGQRKVEVSVNPAAWFRQGAQVMDLSAHTYGVTGQVVPIPNLAVGFAARGR